MSDWTIECWNKSAYAKSVENHLQNWITVLSLGEEIDEANKMEEENVRLRDEVEAMKHKYQMMLDYAREHNLEIAS